MGEADNRVGYGRPPKETRFKPGKSGNPAGRPKSRPTIDDFVRKLLDEPTTIMTDGRRITVSGREAVAVRYFEGALEGDRDALKKVNAVDQERDRFEDENETETVPPEDAEIMELYAEQSADTASADPKPESPPLKTVENGSEDAGSR
ncbi:MAG: DUF5681 domain-containing protein [Chloroflexota bacterium]